VTPLATLAEPEVADPSSGVRISDNPHRPERIRVAIRVEDGRKVPWWSHAVEERLERLVNLEPNWNSHGAQPPKPEAIFLAVRIIASLLRADDARLVPQIVPTWPGGLQLEWHLQPADIEISIDPRNAVWAYISTQEGSEDGPLTQMEEKVAAILTQVVN
jgi:hypothetical protein